MHEVLMLIDFYKEDLQEIATEIKVDLSGLINKSFLINNQAWHQIDHRYLFESLLSA